MQNSSFVPAAVALVVTMIGTACPSDPVAGQFNPRPEFADATTFRCACTLTFDDQGGPADTVVVGQVCLASRTFCDVAPELAAGCESRTTADDCQDPRCPDLEERQENPIPLTGATRREYVRWALNCAEVPQTTPVGSGACGELDIPCGTDGDCGGDRICLANGECSRCPRGKGCSQPRCLRAGTSGDNARDFDGFCEIECEQDSDCPMGRGQCSAGVCGECRDGFECEAQRACTTGDGAKDVAIDAALDTCPVTELDNGCAVSVDLDLCRAADTDNDTQCFRACEGLAFLTDFDVNGIDASIFSYQCGSGGGCATFDGTCEPNTTPNSVVTEDLSGVAQECGFLCPEDPEEVPPIACLEDDVECEVDADCPVDELLVFFGCVGGECERRPCPTGLACEEGVNSGELEDGTLVSGNLCSALVGCTRLNTDECSQVRIGGRPESSTRPDCHAGFESAPFCRVPMEDPPVHTFGGVLGELNTDQSSARLRSESSLTVTLGGQTASTPLRGSVDVVGQPCPEDQCEVSIRILVQGDDVELSSCALPPFDACQSDDDCPSAGFQIPCVLGGCADFSDFCSSDTDCPVVETQVACLPGVALTDISLHAGTGTTPVIPIDETGRGQVAAGDLSGTLAINVAGTLMGATGPSLGAGAQVKVDWLNKRVEINDAFETGALATDLHIVADIQNYAPVAVVESERIELGCTDASGTPLSLRAQPVDLDGPQDILLHGWMRGTSSAGFAGEGLGLNVAALETVAPMGTTRFTYRVRDRAFRESTAATIVTVTNAAPTAAVTAPATTECSSFEGGVVHLSAADSFDPDGTLPGDVAWHLGSADGPLLASGVEADVTLPLGEHRIVALVTDPCGKSDVAEIVVNVVDTTPPSLSAFSFEGPSCLWPPFHRLAVIDLSRDFDAEIVDACDPNPRLELLSASSDEPDNALGDGDTANDVMLFDDRVCLRAERRGLGDGRTYSLQLVAVDASGNAFDPVVEVVVPRDQRHVTRCREMAEEIVDDGHPRCAAEVNASAEAPPRAVGEGEDASADVEGRLPTTEGAAVASESASCASTGASSPLAALVLAMLAVWRARRRTCIPVLAAAVAMAGAGCPSAPPAERLPALQGGAPPSGMIDGRAFNAQSFLARFNGRGDLVISIADYPLSCNRTLPPDDALPSLPRAVLVLIDQEHARPGLLHIEFPEVQEARANVNLYDAESNARSVVIRRGEITIDAIDAENVRGAGSLLETSTEVSIAGSFDISLCPP